MVDSQTSDLDLAMDLGFRIVKTPFDPPTFQYQQVDNKGKAINVMPTHEHAYTLWQKLVQAAQELGTALDDPERNGGEEQLKATAPQVS